MGLGGGAGVWLSGHLSYHLAGAALSLGTLSCAGALYFVPQVYSIKDTRLRDSFKLIVVDFKQLMSSPMALFTLAVAIMPIAIGAAAYVWSSIAKDWQVKADTVALVTGALSAGVSAIGCVVGYGWLINWDDGHGLCCFFCLGAACDRTEQGFYQVCLILFPRQHSSGLFGGLGWVDA